MGNDVSNDLIDFYISRKNNQSKITLTTTFISPVLLYFYAQIIREKLLQSTNIQMVRTVSKDWPIVLVIEDSYMRTVPYQLTKKKPTHVQFHIMHSSTFLHMCLAPLFFFLKFTLLVFYCKRLAFRGVIYA